MKAAALGLLVALGATPAIPGGWESFYTPSGSPSAPSGSTLGQTAEIGVCLRAILDAQVRHNIPGNLLLGIGLQEAGTRRDGALTVWPWSVNAAGEGRLFESREAAMRWVWDQQEAGIRSIDVGCMQVNLRWHPEAFQSLADGFDPVQNADYAARFLRSLYDQTGDWELAAGSYHSFTPEHRDVYLASLERNLAVVNERRDELETLAYALPASARSAGQATQLQTRVEGGFWAAALSDGTGAGRRSLYSQEDLRPVLPTFRNVP